MSNGLDDFAIFILTHGRPDNVVTYRTLQQANYSGRVFIVIDNEDKQADAYRKEFGDKVIMFDKLAVSKTFDEADNFEDRRAIVYARNACFQIAKDLGIKYFMEFDDDYVEFHYRMDHTGEYPKKFSKIKKDITGVFAAYLEFFKNTPIHSVALSQGGDYIGGSQNKMANNNLVRKCMNSFICSTDRPFQFIGRINEDVNTYTKMASIGHLFFTAPMVSLTQKQTQSNSGGMTDIYEDNGTYVKSFYSVLFQPSSVKIKQMGSTQRRLHHSVKWNHTLPKIMAETVKK